MKKYAGIEFYIPYEKKMDRGFISGVSDTLYIHIGKNGEVLATTLMGQADVLDAEMEMDITMPRDDVEALIDNYQATQQQAPSYAKAFLEGFRAGHKEFKND